MDAEYSILEARLAETIRLAFEWMILRASFKLPPMENER